MSEIDMSVDSNPYRSPNTFPVAPGTIESARTSRLEELGRVIVTWEKLRLLYNGIGLLPTVLIVIVAGSHPFEIAGCAFLANLCFCLGPLVDGYLTWFGFRHRAVTVVLFVLGTFLMLLLAAGYAMAVMSVALF